MFWHYYLLEHKEENDVIFVGKSFI